MSLDVRLRLATVVLVLALGTGAEAGRPSWLGGKPKPPTPQYVAPPLKQPGQRTVRVSLDEAQRIAGSVYRQSSGLKAIGALYARRAQLTPREARRAVQKIGREIEAKYGLKVRLVDDRFKLDGLDAADGPNPGKWVDAEGVIYLRANMRPDRLVRELGHEYGAFLLARQLGGRGQIPAIGESGLGTTHVLDGLVQGQGRL